MEEKEIKEFIEKLFLTIETKGLDIESDIKSLDNSIDFRVIINFLHDNDLLKETNEYSDELTAKGLKLKELKTFEGLENDICFKEYVLTELNNIKNGGFITVTKNLEDKERIINRVVLKLYNLGVLKKDGKKYIVSEQKHLSKIIELKSIDKYLKWSESYDEPPEKEKWFNQNITGFAIAFIVFLFNVYQYFDNRSLRSDFDSLKNQYEIYKDSTFQLKKELEIQKKVKVLNTLQTKN